MSGINTPQKQNLVKQACLKHPKLPTLTLARMLYNENPHLWPRLESARDSVRKCRGNHGAMHRKHTADKTLYRPNQEAGYVWRMPATLAKTPVPYQLEARETLVLSDIHVPFHDRAAVHAAINEGVRRNVDCVLLNGDTVDFYGISRFAKDPTVTNLIEEIKCAREFLGWLRQKFPKAKIIFKEGNHDERMSAYFCQKAPELLGIETIGLRHLLTAENVLSDHPTPAIGDIDWVSGQRVIKAGHLNIWHGHEIGKGSIAPPVNPARGLFMRTLECGLMGHLHKDSSHNEMTANGKLVACWSTGCLCGLYPDYAKVNKWTQSCAVVSMHRGMFGVTPIRILNGKVL